MQTSARRNADISESGPPESGTDAADRTVVKEIDPERDAFDEVLGLLEDGHTRQLLRDLDGTARPARELAERSDASRTTVYRRLNRLEANGLVAGTTQLQADGHHRKQFVSRFLGVSMTVVEGRMVIRLRLRPATRSGPTPGEGSMEDPAKPGLGPVD
jgi:DNA-binding transcriptional ArsR family regulator